MAQRHYLATFDLVNSDGRQAEYAKARAALEFLVGKSNYYRPVKQCCVLKSDGSVNAARIKRTLTQILGSDCNVLVVDCSAVMPFIFWTATAALKRRYFFAS